MADLEEALSLCQRRGDHGGEAITWLARADSNLSKLLIGISTS